MREFLASSPKTLEQAFLEVDKKSVGKVTNLEFKRAFRMLNIALTAKEIDLLLNFTGYRAGHLIEWRDFIKILDLSPEKKEIRARLHPRLQTISDLLHYYMISPKDAFRKVHFPLLSGTTQGQATSTLRSSPK